MKKCSLKVAVGFAALTISTLTLPFEAANAQPDGMRGSYVGITVDADNALGLTQDFFQQTSSPASWVFNKALQSPAQFAPAITTRSSSSEPSGVNSQGLQGRVDLGNLPISLRGKLFLSPESSVVQPMLSYDLGIARNTNIYAGAGYSFTNSKDKTSTPVNPNAIVVTAGAEAAVGEKVVIYGDAQYQLNKPNITEAFPVKVQFGFGYRF